MTSITIKQTRLNTPAVFILHRVAENPVFRMCAAHVFIFCGDFFSSIERLKTVYYFVNYNLFAFDLDFK